MRPRLNIVLVGVAMVLVVSAAASVRTWPRWNTRLAAQICVERPENNGVLNIRQAEVAIRGGPSLMLMGGDAACAFVEGGGKYTVWAQSPDPYDPSNPNPAAWRSKDFDVAVAEKGRVELELCAKASNAAYKTWELQRAGDGCAS